MRIYIVIPAHNEESYLVKTLDSLLSQSLLPNKIMVVNDNSTDATESILKEYSNKFQIITYTNLNSNNLHQPGSKVINAFQAGVNLLDENYDILCKFDADLIFPNDYLEKIATIFQEDAKCGMAGGFCAIEKNNVWVLENLTDSDHIRGALKAYRKNCYQEIGGLKASMGWDTVDELLAKYHGWKVVTDQSLLVKHLKPTGLNYDKSSRFKQGMAFRKMRYGFWLTLIASLKLAFKKKSLAYFIYCIQGYFKNGKHYIVSDEEGRAIRSLRWKGVKKKLFF